MQDTVGCGDSFAAAVALGFTRGHGPEATLALANAVGAATAMGRGGQGFISLPECRIVLAEATLALANAIDAATAMGRGCVISPPDRCGICSRAEQSGPNVCSQQQLACGSEAWVCQCGAGELRLGVGLQRLAPAGIAVQSV